ncbi:hypothetical protein DCC85_01955 [Paenibacillus sp. CAA11]|uniref:hypothetical protein n=1 Tax=Paenibacillus sp. CAA11 TaxID=1532905 RepID=UPI000D3D2CE0|nr:hypothetical protein [Paenibacillus sp. CAA11]AWB43116.1 hypothetical protein DCC85_01955 [Paenibacillus sp. CAA11]
MNIKFYNKVWLWVVIVLGVVIGLISKERPTEKMTISQEQAVQNESVKKKEVVEPVKEESQKIYKEVALGEAKTYIQLTVRGTIIPEYIQPRFNALSKHVDKITDEERGLFSQLAEAVKSDNLGEAKRLYITLGGEDFEELNKEPEPKKNPSKKATKQQLNPGSIGMDVEEFRKAFNSAAKKMNIDMKLEEIKVEKGSGQDIFTYQLRDSVFLQGVINKTDGSIRTVYMAGAGNGRLQAGQDLLSTMKLLILLNNPDFTDMDIEIVLQDVGLKYDDVDINKINQSTERSGRKYTLVNTKLVGICFIVSDSKDQILWSILNEVMGIENGK